MDCYQDCVVTSSWFLFGGFVDIETNSKYYLQK